MKKILALILALVLLMSLMAGCKKDNEVPVSTDAETEVTETTKQQDENEEIEAVPETVQDEKTTEKQSPTVNKNNKQPTEASPSETTDDDKYYLIANGQTDQERITYHKKICPSLNGKELQELTWEMVSMLGFRHCAKCNPPKYEGYIE